MAKKKVEITKSIALFDEEPPVKKAPVKVKKETKKKKDELDSNNTNNSSSVVNTGHSRSTKTKKENKETRGRKQQSTPSVEKKSRNTSKTTDKKSGRTNTDKKLNGRSTKSNKDNSSKKPAKRVEKESRRSGTATNKSNKQRKDVDRPISTDKAPIAERRTERPTETVDIFKEAKKRKHKWTRGNTIMAPKQITGKPKVISDDLVAVIIDGEYYEVSPWSIRNGMYCQGFDSHFLVHYLHYDPVSTKYDEANAALAKIVETPKEETKKKKKGSK